MKDFKQYLTEKVKVEVQNPQSLEDFEDPQVYFNGIYTYSTLNMKLKGYVDQLSRAVKVKNWKQAGSLMEKGGMSMNIPDLIEAIEQVEKEMGSRTWKSKRTKMKKKG